MHPQHICKSLAVEYEEAGEGGGGGSGSTILGEKLNSAMNPTEAFRKVLKQSNETFSASNLQKGFTLVG